MWAEAYLLIPASMHTCFREPHTHIHAHIAFGLALDFPPGVGLKFWFIFVPACAKPLRRRHGQDKKNIIFICKGFTYKVIIVKTSAPYWDIP
jgi:hypothetical protein